MYISLPILSFSIMAKINIKMKGTVKILEGRVTQPNGPQDAGLTLSINEHKTLAAQKCSIPQSSPGLALLTCPEQCIIIVFS